jgi:hypothetical protein
VDRKQTTTPRKHRVSRPGLAEKQGTRERTRQTLVLCRRLRGAWSSETGWDAHLPEVNPGEKGLGTAPAVVCRREGAFSCAVAALAALAASATLTPFLNPARFQRCDQSDQPGRQALPATGWGTFLAVAGWGPFAWGGT